MNAPLHPSSLAPVSDDEGCQACRTSMLCLPPGLDAGNRARFDWLARQHRRIPRGTHLYRTGQPLRTMYALRCGFCKTSRPGPAGEQVTGFQMAGDLLGLEAIGTGSHQSDAIALEDSVICELPFDALERLFDDAPGLHRRFFRLMSSAINREQHMMLLLANMRAEQRMATFLVELGSAYSLRGYSPTQFHLRMAREDIASYLGLTIESISRLLARFTRLGLISVDKRAVVLHDPIQLAAMADGIAPCSPMA